MSVAAGLCRRGWAGIERPAARVLDWTSNDLRERKQSDTGGYSNGLDRLRHDVHRHVHGDPRRTGRRDITGDHPGSIEYPSGPDELDPEVVLDLGNHRDPAHRLPDVTAADGVGVRL